MSGAQALLAAHAAGIELRTDGGDLVLTASAPPAAAVIDMLLLHKGSIVALLSPRDDGWSADDWLVYFDERAGIVEFDGGLPRRDAEAHAFGCCVTEWLNRKPVRSSPGRCLGCGLEEHVEDPLLPFGTEDTGHAWLHSRCWPAWYAGRKAEAVAVLAAMGITPPVDFPNDFGKNGRA